MSHRGSTDSRYAQSLQKINVYDIKKRISEKLAEDMESQEEKEGKFRKWAAILKTGAKFIPGAGKLLELVVDPALRFAGMGADPSDLKAREGDTAWGGREGYKTARTGLKKSQRDYREKSLIDSLTGMVGGKVLGGLGDKWLTGFGARRGYGGKAIADRFAEQVTSQGLEDNPWLLTEGDWSNGGLIPSYKQGGIVQRFVDGGTVQKYGEGGTVDYYAMSDEQLIEEYKARGATKYELDVFRNALSNPDHDWAGVKDAVIKGLETTRGYEGEADVDALTTSSEEGINEFLRTPELAALINLAKTGDEDAISQLVEVARQQRPELREKNTEDLTTELLGQLKEIDVYGQDYKDVATEAGQQVQGLKGQAVASAGLGSMTAATGVGAGQRQARKVSGSLSSSLSDIYSKRDIGFEDVIEGSFGSFESAVTSVGT